MKTRFNTFDLVCSVTELQRLVGMRVAQVYDIDHKTYLIKLQRKEEKCVLLLESGSRLHTTAFEWPKNVAPSGFSMKMRKHLCNKRLESLHQLGVDRILDLQFGTGEAAYHIILELYDRGNIVLTDCNMIILNILRPHTEGEKIRFAVREKYPLERARQRQGTPSLECLHSIIAEAKPGDALKKILNPHLDYGSAVIEHVLLKAGFPGNCKIGKNFNIEEDLPKLYSALNDAEELMDCAIKSASKGYIIQKKEKRPLTDGGEEDFFANIEFHPVIFQQYSQQPCKEFDSFDAAVDEFFSTLESQKIDMKALQQEKEAMKKLANVKKDHDQRLEALARTQELDKQKAELITRNQELVDNAIFAMRKVIANQVAWPKIQNIVKEAQARGDPIASCIKGLKLQVNKISLLLSDPYAEENSSDENSESENLKPMVIDIDLDLTAFSNARKYYDQKRNAAKKQQKTLESHGKALKSAEKKTIQTLKEMKTITTINKLRKVYWFEKFHWFISSENYLVIGGRDPQQNEVIVKRYMRHGDIYVHADIQGASSIIIKNPTGQPIPPKTLNEAGVMAMSYSVAWEAKVVTSAWWVHSDQVSKTAPTGEYITTGGFMIRGKRNYLPPAHLTMGFSFLFKLEDSSVERHKDERKVRGFDDDVSTTTASLDEMSLESEQDQELELIGSDDDDDEEEEEEKRNHVVQEVDEQVIDQEENLDDTSSPTVKNGEQSCDMEMGGDKEMADDETTTGSEDGDHLDEHEEQEHKVKFPDIEIKIEHNKDNLVTLHTPSASTLGTLPLNTSEGQDQIVFLGDDKPVIVKPSTSWHKKPSESKGKGNARQKLEEVEAKDPVKPQPIKRGQKGKLKKIREKYKYQDEEERKLRMEILQSAGSAKENKKGKKGKDHGGKGSNKIEKTPKPKPVTSKPQASGGQGAEDSDGGEAEEITVAADVNMLDSLTGNPVPEDELLFAVPVVAPYSTLLNYKFKVKLTPGMGKRGKAAKTALNMFLKDKNTSQREKDLIKSVKDENLARNLPGKVKVSAPQLQKLRK